MANTVLFRVLCDGQSSSWRTFLFGGDLMDSPLLLEETRDVRGLIFGFGHTVWQLGHLGLMESISLNLWVDSDMMEIKIIIIICL